MLYKGDEAIRLKSEIDPYAAEKPIVVKNVGFYKDEKSFHKFTFDNNNYIILYLHKGTATLTVNKKNFSISSGTTVVLKKNENSVILYNDDYQNERFYIYFDGYKVNDFLKEFNLNDKYVYNTGERFDFIENTMLLLNKYKREHSFSSTFCHALLLCLLAKTNPFPSKLKNNILQTDSCIKNI